MTAKFILLIAAINGFAAVTLGAFGAHGLKGKLSEALLSAYHTAVQYHFYHTFALIGVSILIIQFGQITVLKLSAVCFMLGIFLFCGSLYALALGAPAWFGPITPLGGLAFLGGWIMLGIAAIGLSEA